MAKIQKGYWKDERPECKKIVVVLKDNTYQSHFGFFKDLVAELIKDFVNLVDDIDEDKIEIIHFGGDSCKYIYGIELVIPYETKIPDDYVQLTRLEYTL